ncbi:hypothetical protein BRC83_02290 [Halobacteriales archaeon QS_1_68_17]|nr:MAG: hypothetical protein BRC83_02290 [Halobacteriales archaeon QS_1_68_17]
MSSVRGTSRCSSNGDETDDQPVSDPDAVDDRVRNERRITISREPAFAHALMTTYPDDIYETEQECREEAARERVVRYRRGTLPEQFLADLLGRIADPGRTVSVSDADERVVVVTGRNDGPPDVDAADVEGLADLPREALAERTGEELRQRDPDQLVGLVRENASRDLLIRVLAAILAEPADEA